MAGEEAGIWQKRARALSRRFPRSCFHPSVERWIAENPGRAPLGVAVSGGADSLCLLLLLWGHLPEWRDRLLVLHFDHRLRGEESEGDRVFVETVAADLGLTVRSGEWMRSDETPVTEETARQARFAFFIEELKTVGHGPPAIFFGHHRDDAVENFLMRLSRGSGANGLAGPRPVQGFRDGRVHLRPLLALSADEIREALDDLEIPFRVDASNSRPGFYRNRLRNEVIPAWQKAAPFDVAAGTAASRALLEEDDEALRFWLRELLPEPESGRKLDFRLLLGKPRALWRRALHEWIQIQELTENLSKNAVDLLLAAAENGEERVVSAGTGVQLVLSENRCLQRKESEELPDPELCEPWPLPLQGTLLLPARRELKAQMRELDADLRERILGGAVDERMAAFVEWSGGRFFVRNWRPGDRYRPLGAPGSKKLQDLFVDRKISVRERRTLPVVIFNSKIVWVPGFPPADASRINRLTKEVVQLTYRSGGTV